MRTTDPNYLTYSVWPRQWKTFEIHSLPSRDRKLVENFRSVVLLTIPHEQLCFCILSCQLLSSDIFATLVESKSQAATHRLYFGRDPLGRRSLLIHKPTTNRPYLLLSSVSAGANPAYDFVELSTEHIYSLDLASLRKASDVSS